MTSTSIDQYSIEFNKQISAVLSLLFDEMLPIPNPEKYSQGQHKLKYTWMVKAGMSSPQFYA